MKTLTLLFTLAFGSTAFAQVLPQVSKNVANRVASINCLEVPTPFHIRLKAELADSGNLSVSLDSPGNSIEYTERHVASLYLKRVTAEANVWFWGKLSVVTDQGQHYQIWANNQAGQLRMTVAKATGDTRFEILPAGEKNFVTIPNRGAFCQLKLSSTALETVGALSIH